MATVSLVAAICWAVAVTGAVMIATMLRNRRSRSGPATEPTVALATADLVLGGAVGLAAYLAIVAIGPRAIRLTIFGGIAITYLILVVGVPLALAALLGFAALRRRGAIGQPTGRLATRPALVVCGAGLLLAPVGFYATHIEPGLLDVDRPPPLALAEDRAGAQPLTIGVLTDLQTTAIGDREHSVVTELMAAEPDLILLPGDLLQTDDAEFDRQLPALRQLLGRLDAPGGVFLVGGDVDQPLDRLPRMVEGTPVRYLADEVATTSVGDRTVTVGGIGLDYRSPAATAVVDELEQAPGTGDIRILLAHRPDPVLDLRPDSRIDLQVSGHTHGGQVSVPFFGPLMTLSGVPRPIAAGGLNHHDGHAIYVGHGVGLERGAAPQVRFGVRPDIGVLTLEG